MEARSRLPDEKIRQAPCSTQHSGANPTNQGLAFLVGRAFRSGGEFSDCGPQTRIQFELRLSAWSSFFVISTMAFEPLPAEEHDSLVGQLGSNPSFFSFRGAIYGHLFHKTSA